MVEVFISHSRKDIELVNRIYKALYQVGIKPNLAEFEQLGEVGKLSATHIRNMIVRSSWTMVFLTPNVSSSVYTRNWVSYEVGVSHGLGKQVWIFESEGHPLTDFPIPYLNYYFLYDPKSSQDWNAIKEEVRKYIKSPNLVPAIVGLLLGAPLGPPWAIFGALAGYAKSLSDLEREKALSPSGFVKVKITCPCGSEYEVIGRYENLIKGFRCPTCRKYLIKLKK